MLRIILAGLALALGLLEAAAQTPNATCALTFNNSYTAATNANAGTAAVTGSDPNGLTNIVISLDGTALQTCAAAATGTTTCNANTSWTSNNTPHVISAVCTSVSTLKQNVSVTYPN